MDTIFYLENESIQGSLSPLDVRQFEQLGFANGSLNRLHSTETILEFARKNIVFHIKVVDTRYQTIYDEAVSSLVFYTDTNFYGLNILFCAYWKQFFILSIRLGTDEYDVKML